MATEEKDALREKRLANLTAPRFQPGQSGNPSGRPKNVLSKALRRKLEALESDAPDARVNADVLTDKLFELAVAGNVEAMKMCFDRMEGRARQSISVDVDEQSRLESRLQNYLSESEREGDPLTRAAAILILAEEDPRYEDYE